MKKTIRVVGAVIHRENKILCAQRPAEKSLGNFWEFPGGKIEVGEGEQQALEREIREELRCEIVIQDKIITTVYEYDFGIVELTTFNCKLISGEPILTEHQEIKWLTRDQLPLLEWASADVPTIKFLMSEGSEF